MSKLTERRVAAFREVSGLRSAVASLRDAGIEGFEVFSNVPIEGLKGGRSRVLNFALAGGVAGGFGAYLLTSLSAQAYPLVTGGMPIVAGPPVGLVTYEGTALGAILATVLGVLLEGRLPGGRAPSDSVADLLAEGYHVLQIDDPAEQLEELFADADAVVEPSSDDGETAEVP